MILLSSSIRSHLKNESYEVKMFINNRAKPDSKFQKISLNYFEL